MTLETSATALVTSAEVAQVLSAATPEEFARIWLKLSQLSLSDDVKHSWADALSQKVGASGRHLLEELLRISTFYRVMRDMPPPEDVEPLASEAEDII